MDKVLAFVLMMIMAAITLGLGWRGAWWLVTGHGGALDALLAAAFAIVGIVAVVLALRILREPS